MKTLRLDVQFELIECALCCILCEDTVSWNNDIRKDHIPLCRPSQDPDKYLETLYMLSPTLASLAIHRPSDGCRLLVPVWIDCEGKLGGVSMLKRCHNSVCIPLVPLDIVYSTCRLQRHIHKGHDIRMQVVYLLDLPHPENEPDTIENESDPENNLKNSSCEHTVKSQTLLSVPKCVASGLSHPINSHQSHP